MKELTVKQLAAISGVTVRALHYYDEIGLLQPASVGANGYRYYGRKEQLRLQRILFHRELGVPLNAIADILELEGEDQVGVLRQKGEKTMANAELYKGFSPEKQAGYEAWLVEKYGEPMRASIEHQKKSWSKRSAAEQKEFLEASGRQIFGLEQALAGALREGVDPDSDAVDALISRHRDWVAMMWGRPCSPESYSGLADLYLAHPDFVARYEATEKGFAEYLASAMKLHAKKRS